LKLPKLVLYRNCVFFALPKIYVFNATKDFFLKKKKDVPLLHILILSYKSAVPQKTITHVSRNHCSVLSVLCVASKHDYIVQPCIVTFVDSITNSYSFIILWRI